MTDGEKFEGFKQQMIDENEATYGVEIRRQYGEEAVNKSNAKLQQVTREEYEEWTRLGNEVKATLAEAFKTGNPASDTSQKAAVFCQAKSPEKIVCFYPSI